ncbi:MAG: PfkB family carbohydrate kinase [Cyanobacteria bacterium J06598_3]
MTLQHGLFVGLTTLDCIYQADHPPATNEKIVADKSLLVAGGPATNAAVAFAQLGKHNRATLSSVIGAHPLTSIIKEDLHEYGVTVADLDPSRPDLPPVSSIVVSHATGERAVITRNAVNMQAQPSQILPELLEGVSIVLVDGHQMVLSAQIAQWANAKQIPVVVDAGSWKPGFETVLALAEVVVASANFSPPECTTAQDVVVYLKSLGVPNVAITRGAESILYQDSGLNAADQAPQDSDANHLDKTVLHELDVPQVRALDTLGAGDIFHGAFCHFYLTHTFAESLLKASRSASFACQYWGTRDWTKIYRMVDEDENEESENP